MPPGIYFFRKKCPAPGNTRVDNRAAFVGLFIYSINVYIKLFTHFIARLFLAAGSHDK
jgi:hypothetical protein